ncbi:hypothetical protein [Rhodopseudomonas palustris]|nr:hypothetical protein [Rhodopseudomonas palustris]
MPALSLAATDIIGGAAAPQIITSINAWSDPPWRSPPACCAGRGGREWDRYLRRPKKFRHRFVEIAEIRCGVIEISDVSGMFAANAWTCTAGAVGAKPSKKGISWRSQQ